VEESALVNDLELHEKPSSLLTVTTKVAKPMAESYLIALQQAKLYEMKTQ